MGSKIDVCLLHDTMMKKRTAITAGLLPATLVLCATVLAQGASGQIAKVVDDGGRPFFVNAEPPVSAKLSASKPRTNIYLSAEASFSGLGRPPSYFRPGSGRLADAFINRHAIHKDVTPDGRIVFTNE